MNDPHDKAEVAAALFKVKLPEAVAGPDRLHLDQRQDNPAPGVAITPPVGIQWQKGTKYPLEAKVVDNTLQPDAKITGDLLPTLNDTRPDGSPLLELDHVTKRFGRVVIAEDLSLRGRRRGHGRNRGAERGGQDQPVRPHLR